jgi:hypothetical protein
MPKPKPNARPQRQSLRRSTTRRSRVCGLALRRGLDARSNHERL